jgi:prepilin-type N-terminal cleavage/methylation domain-containing protein/prepilin-type processing-associated H-X9-DG protein
MRVDDRAERTSGGRGFSIIELLVAIGIISILLAFLFPALSAARQRAESLQCQSNLRQIGMMLQIYANNNNAWPSPVIMSPEGKPVGRGILLPPNQRWPVYVFDVPAALPGEGDAPGDDPWPFTPAILRCPSESDPGEAHSYIVNWDPIADHAKAGNGHMAFERSAELVIMAEKFGIRTDYYLEPFKDLSSIVDFYHHKTLYSNYLYGDGHVQPATPEEAARDIRHVPSDEVP